MSKKSAVILLSCLFFTACVTLSGCGGPTSQDVPKVPDEVRGQKVVIRGSEFHPQILLVKVGETVTFTNEDSVAHSAIASDKSFDTGPIEPKQSATVRIASEEQINYFCAAHPYMHGVINAQR